MTCVPEAGCRAGAAKAWRGRPVPAQTRNSQAAPSHGFSEAAEKGRGSPGTLLPSGSVPSCSLLNVPLPTRVWLSLHRPVTPVWLGPTWRAQRAACVTWRRPHCRACRALIDLQRLAQGPSLPESLDPVVTAFLEGVVGLVRGLAEAHAEPGDYEEPPRPPAPQQDRGRSRDRSRGRSRAHGRSRSRSRSRSLGRQGGKGPSPGNHKGKGKGKKKGKSGGRSGPQLQRQLVQAAEAILAAEGRC